MFWSEKLNWDLSSGALVSSHLIEERQRVCAGKVRLCLHELLSPSHLCQH